MSTDRAYWQIAIKDPTKVPEVMAKLNEEAGTTGVPLHPMGEKYYALAKSVEDRLIEKWGRQILETELNRLFYSGRYMESKRIMPEWVTMDPQQPEVETDVFHQWGDASVDPRATDGVHWYHEMCRFPKAWDMLGWRQKSTPRGDFRIGHLDTGTTDHPVLGGISGAAGEWVDLASGTDTHEDDRDATDPNTDRGLFEMAGHGTRIGSVIYGSRAEYHQGGAPGAPVVPIRTGNSVVISEKLPNAADPDDFCDGMDYAVAQGCAVLNSSMGGPLVAGGLKRMENSVRAAYRAGVILCAAAGNVVEAPQNPGRMPASICLAAVNDHGLPWSGTAHGVEVDISAPGEGIWRGDLFKQHGKRRYHFGNSGSGTSYATALATAAACLWLNYRKTELEALPELWMRVEAFRHCLRNSADQPSQNAFLQKFLGPEKLNRITWDPREMGTGILNVEKLLLHPFPSAGDLSPAIDL